MELLTSFTHVARFAFRDIRNIMCSLGPCHLFTLPVRSPNGAVHIWNCNFVGYQYSNVDLAVACELILTNTNDPSSLPIWPRVLVHTSFSAMPGDQGSSCNSAKIPISLYEKVKVEKVATYANMLRKARQIDPRDPYNCILEFLIVLTYLGCQDPKNSMPVIPGLPVNHGFPADMSPFQRLAQTTEENKKLHHSPQFVENVGILPKDLPMQNILPQSLTPKVATFKIQRETEETPVRNSWGRKYEYKPKGAKSTSKPRPGSQKPGPRTFPAPNSQSLSTPSTVQSSDPEPPIDFSILQVKCIYTPYTAS